MGKKKKYLIELEKKNYPLALTLIDNELKEDSSNPELLYNLAICCARTGNFKKCNTVLNDLINKSIKFIDIDNVYRLMIFSNIQLKEFDKALEITDERLKINLGDIRLLSFRAHILEKTSKIHDAVQIHKNILKLNPDYLNSLNSVAYLTAIQPNSSKEELIEAMECIKLALKNDPNNPAYLDTLGVILKRQGNRDQALRAFNKALSKAHTSTSEIIDHLQDLL
ncbi:MAG: tetratricopeptide repeat protein [Spirochaetia bacterium]|nr:tetratricopeptide repeat protein [Spirochaetia bacterium]